MKELTIIGAGTCGLNLIENFRAKNSKCEITLIDSDTFYFPNNDKVFKPGNISSRVDIAVWAKTKKVKFINSKVDRINANRKKVYFKDAVSINFEKLVVATGLKSKKLEVKGEHRQGFFYLSDIDPFVLKDYLKVSQEATVYVSTFLGLKLVAALNFLGKEVKLVAPNLDFLGESKDRIVEFLDKKGISLYLNSQLEEAVGEASIKAIKISPLKVFSSQFLFIDSGFKRNCEFFEEEILCENKFFTNYEDVYFLGDVNNKNIDEEIFFAYNYANCQNQAKVLAVYLSENKEINFTKRILSEEEKSKLLADFWQEKEVVA